MPEGAVPLGLTLDHSQPVFVQRLFLAHANERLSARFG